MRPAAPNPSIPAAPRSIARLAAVVLALALARAVPAADNRPAVGAAAGRVAVDPHIVVDQFGYRPADPKVAVIRNPRTGFDSASRFAPGTRYEVRRADDGAVALSGAPVPWNDGAVQDSSGDQGWWFDFSALAAAGTYFVLDVERGARSPTFAVGAAVYAPVLKAAVRTFYYQRSGFEKRAPAAQACWTDRAAYRGARQDSEAHDVTDRDNPAKVRDLSGGWFDAGDTNKYVTFAAPAVHQLLTAYTNNPAVFTDDFDIPESGNGLPDLIDELKWETDWLKKMQFDDGSVALKVGGITNVTPSPPSTDAAPRFYVPACTSATIAAAGMFAHAARVYARFPALAEDAADLTRRAIKAWDRYQAAPRKQTDCDTGVVKSGRADLDEPDQRGTAVTAAVYLYAATGEARYQAYLRDNYRQARPYRDFGWSRYNADQGEALLYFTTLPDADAQLRRTILEDKRKDVVAGNQVYGLRASDDLYRAFLHDAQYHWGSNQVRANYGNSNLDALRYGPGEPVKDPQRDVDLAKGKAAPKGRDRTAGKDVGKARDPDKASEKGSDKGSDNDPDRDGSGAAELRARALGVLNYLHGVNPFGKVFLSNMAALGATASVDQIWHSWYAAGSRWADARASNCGPAPGYLVGGPNANAARDGVPATLVPPVGQPRQKAWRDTNAPWPESSWVITEPAIYYQAAYVKLLSEFTR